MPRRERPPSASGGRRRGPVREICAACAAARLAEERWVNLPPSGVGRDLPPVAGGHTRRAGWDSTALRTRHRQDRTALLSHRHLDGRNGTAGDKRCGSRCRSRSAGGPATRSNPAQQPRCPFCPEDAATRSSRPATSILLPEAGAGRSSTIARQRVAVPSRPRAADEDVHVLVPVSGAQRRQERGSATAYPLPTWSGCASRVSVAAAR